MVVFAQTDSVTVRAPTVEHNVQPVSLNRVRKLNQFLTLVIVAALVLDDIEDRTPYVFVALFTFVAFLSGLCCIATCQVFVEKAFAEDERERRSHASGVSYSQDGSLTVYLNEHFYNF